MNFLFSLIFFLSLLHSIQSEYEKVRCHKNKTLECHDGCFMEVFPEKNSNSSCIEAMPDVFQHIESSSCCLQQDGCLLISEDPKGRWYLKQPKLILKCCRSNGCLDVKPVMLPIPLTGDRFYNKTSYYIFFCTILVLTTIFGFWPFVYRLKETIRSQKKMAYDKNPELAEELFTQKNAEWPEEMKISQKHKASGLITLEKMSTVIDELKKIEEGKRQEVTKEEKQSDSIMLAEHLVYQKGGSDMVLYARLMPTKYETVLHQMLEHGPGAFSLDAVEVNEVLDQSFNIFAAEASLIEIRSPCLVIGEFRASYPDLFRWLQIGGFPPKKKLIFAGGIFNSTSPGAIETLTLVAALKAALPYDVFIVRGVSEMYNYQFTGRYPKSVCNGLSAAVNRMCSQMPLAALVDDRILVVHSGVSKTIKSLNSIRKIHRPIHYTIIPEIVKQLVFNLPSLDRPSKNKEGTGHWFNEEAVFSVCENLNLDMIIRGRGPSQRGYFMFANRRMLSLWSHSGSKKGDFGSVASILADGQIQLHSIMYEEEATA